MFRVLLCSVAFVVVAGCGVDDRKGASPASQSTTASRSGQTAAMSTTETPPVLPRVAKVKSPAGARAFAKYFIEVHNHALRTGRTEELRNAIAPECFVCLSIPTLVESTYRAGGRIAGGHWIPTTSVSTVPNYAGSPRFDELAFLQLSIRIQPMTTFTDGDRAMGSYPGSHHDRSLMVWTSWREGRWLVSEFQGISGQQM